MVLLHSETVEKEKGEQNLQPLSVRVENINSDSIEFDIVGVDSSVANSIRRTMHADVPTLAIETVFVANNTSVIPDEVFAHRLGLIPIWYKDLMVPGHTPITLSNPIILTLRLQNTCKQAISIYSRELTVKEESLKEMVKIIDPDILLVRLAANQEVDLELACVEGTGREHAKWSPVAAASYRLLLDIRILEPITGQDAVKFAKCFARGVVEIEKDRAVVKNPRFDMVSRECLRHSEFEGKVELKRVDDHFIFNVEIIGQLSPFEVVDKSLDVLISQCDILLAAL